MEKLPQFNNTPKNIEEPKKEIGQSSGLSKLIKAAVITVGMAGAHPSFAQNNDASLDKNKIEYKTEILQDISTYYHKLAQFKETTLNYIDYKTSPAEMTSRMEKEIKNEITLCNEIEKNPEQFYKRKVEEAERIRSELISYYSSPVFLGRLQEHMTDEEAKTKQESLIKNLNNVKISVDNPDSIKKRISGAGAMYLIKEHKILIPFADTDEEYIYHELIHSAYRADKLIDKEEQIMLWKQYKHNKKINNEYQRDPAERIVRVEEAIIGLNSKLINDSRYIGILKEGEKFSKQHYDRLMDLKKQHRIGKDMDDILNTTSEKQFIKLMNEIADSGIKKESANQNLA